MKASKLIAMCALLSVMHLPTWAQTIKITIVRDTSPTAVISASADYTVVAGQSRTFDNMQTVEFASASGDCTMGDTNKRQQKAKSREVLRLATTAYEGYAIVQIEFEQRRFLGTPPIKGNQNCIENYANTDGIDIKQTALLRVGEQPILLSGSPGLKIFGVIEP